MKRFINWLKDRYAGGGAEPSTDLRQTGAHAPPRRTVPTQAVPDRQPEFVDLDPHAGGRIKGLGPGKNVLIRNKFVREETGTHDTLRILDDSLIETEEEEGMDPYNTGRFDRSRHWDSRRK